MQKEGVYHNLRSDKGQPPWGKLARGKNSFARPRRPVGSPPCIPRWEAEFDFVSPSASSAPLHRILIPRSLTPSPISILPPERKPIDRSWSRVERPGNRTTARCLPGDGPQLGENRHSRPPTKPPDSIRGSGGHRDAPLAWRWNRATSSSSSQ